MWISAIIKPKVVITMVKSMISSDDCNPMIQNDCKAMIANQWLDPIIARLLVADSLAI